jgi:TolA-binding protein
MLHTGVGSLSTAGVLSMPHPPRLRLLFLTCAFFGALSGLVARAAPFKSPAAANVQPVETQTAASTDRTFASRQPAASRQELARRFSRLARTWHAVQPTFNFNSSPVWELPPAPSGSAEYAGYQKALEAAQAYLEVAAQLEDKPSHNTQTALYFAALSAWSLDQSELMLEFIERLLPLDYRRPMLYDFPAAAREVGPELRHLRLNAWLESAKKNQLPRGHTAFSLLQAVREEAAQATAVRLQVLEVPTAGQMRANTLPTPERLLHEFYQRYLGAAARQDRRGLRTFLLQASRGEYEAEFFALQLQELDRVLIAQLKADAAKATREKRFEDAKKTYRELMAAYPGEAQWAQGELKKIVPVAVAFYKDEGDKNFQPDKPDQFGVPQTKAAEYYEKMYKEDPDGAQADYALFEWSEALGTVGKVAQGAKQMEEWLKKYPRGNPLRAKVMYTLAFFYGSQPMKKYDEAIKLMKQVVEEYPKTEYAPEALWHTALFYVWGSDQYTEGLPYLQKLQAEYPQSFRWKYTDGWIKKFQEEAAKRN